MSEYTNKDKIGFYLETDINLKEHVKNFKTDVKELGLNTNRKISVNEFMNNVLLHYFSFDVVSFLENDYKSYIGDMEFIAMFQPKKAQVRTKTKNELKNENEQLRKELEKLQNGKNK